MSKKNPLQQHLAPFLKPIAFTYGKLMQWRRAAYGHGLLKSFKTSLPTVSVGNISWGGTGKTPIVNWILTWAANRKLRAVVLTRGYKASPPSLPFWVQVTSSPTEAGDEPLMLARKNPSAMVLVDPKRSRAAEYAQKKLQPDLFVLDDGYQHLALGRDKNIVLITEYDLTEGWNQVIPAGTWRETEKALNAADVFLLRLNCDAKWEDLLALAKSKLPGKPIFPFCFRNVALSSLTAPSSKVTSLSGRAYNLFCGVGSPEGVLASTKEFLGYGPQEFYKFPDHYNYTVQDLKRLCASGLDLLCTEKDAVKLLKLLEAMPSDYTPPCSIWVLQLDVDFPAIASGLTFANWWEKTFGSIISNSSSNFSNPHALTNASNPANVLTNAPINAPTNAPTNAPIG